MNIIQNPASLSLNPFTQPASHSQPSVNCIQFYKLTEFSTIHIFTDFPTSPLPFTRQYYFPLSIQKKDKDGKGRLCCLGGRRIHSIPCGPSCFASDNFEEYDEFVFFQIILHGAIHPVIQNLPGQNSQRGKEFNTILPPNRSDDLCLLLCLYPSSMSLSKSK